MSNKRAFTVIEQLVMIAVFPLLMTLLLPALQRVRRVASMDEKLQRLLKAGLYIDSFLCSPGALAVDII
jgi:type II secretory pathway pseudopilin PulG